MSNPLRVYSTLAELRAELLPGNTPNTLPSFVLETGETYQWSSTSTAADDGAFTIKPNNISGAGRYVAQTSQPAFAPYVPPSSGTTVLPQISGASYQAGGTVAAPTSEVVFRLYPRDTTKGPFGLYLNVAKFNSTWDNMLSLGYNYNFEIASEPRALWAVEQDYEASPGVHVIEMYAEARNQDASKLVRPFYAAVGRGTWTCNPVVMFGYGAADEAQIQDPTGAVYARFGKNGAFVGLASLTAEIDCSLFTLAAGSNVTFQSTGGFIALQPQAAGAHIYFDADNIHFRTTQAGAVLGLWTSAGLALSTPLLRASGVAPAEGYASIALPDSNSVASNAQIAAKTHRLTGALTAQRNFQVPLVSGASYQVHNATGQGVQYIGATGTGVVVAAGAKTFVYCDGVNWY